jgi:hypothetical protein
MKRAVLSLLCLTTFATSASAECAWVLWSERMPEPVEWQVLDASGTEAKCRLALKKRLETSHESWSVNADVEFHGFESGYFVVTRKRNEMGLAKPVFGPVNLYCLPDTVDPRGPKGGR